MLWLAACSDYTLDNQPEEADKPHVRDSGRVDTSTDGETAEPVETGGTTVPVETEHPDGRIDVVLVLDLAYGYSCYAEDISVEGQALIDALFDSGANVAVAVASYDDYQVDGEWYANTNGLPYKLNQQLTTDRALAKAAVAPLVTEFGGDWEGSGLEAIAQVGKGQGYDQDCDKSYDAKNDIKPFEKDSGDAFGGKVAGTYDSGVAGTGDIGGVGFRDASARIVVVASNDRWRDKAVGGEVPSGTCPDAATRSSAEAALTAVNAKFLGINHYEFWDIDATAQDQMEDMASRTNSKVDMDGDGAEDDLAVFGGDWRWPATGRVVRAIWDLAD